ncbi:hypothetical protein GW17_00036925 [Ensete ventricosum]|nr:hypothetical protein GW17_00036925 [Ensete ventricosum]
MSCGQEGRTIECFHGSSASQSKVREEEEEERACVTVPAVGDGDNAGAVLGDLEEHGHGEVEVGAGRVAPAAVIGGESVVGGAEVGGRDEDGRGAALAPPGIVRAPDLKARPTAEPVVEQRSAQRRRLDPVPLAVEVPVPTRPACDNQPVNQAKCRWVAGERSSDGRYVPMVPEASLPP